MAARALFRAFSAHKYPLSDSLSAWKGSLLGAKIHTTAAKEAENSWTSKFMNSLEGPINDERKDFARGFQNRQNTEEAHTITPREGGRFGKLNHMTFVKGALEDDRRQFVGGVQRLQNVTEERSDIVHIKLIKNNTFVTITDSKGNKKVGASSGCLEEMKGGPKLSRYAAEATAEHVGRLARTLGLKSVVMRVNGFTHFKKKKQAILSWREGYTFGRGDQNPIAYIEDTTRRPHNGCRLPKRRRV